MSSLLGNAERRLAVLVLQTRVGSGPEEQPHALALVLDDAVVQGSVALAGLLVEAARVLDDEVHHVQRVAGLVRDGVVQTSFSKFLKNKKPNFIYVNGFCSKCENIEKSINFIFETTLRSVHTRWLH